MKKEPKKIKFLDVIIIAIFVCIVIFTYQMSKSFQNADGVEQSTLISCVFALATAELAFCWRIKAAKKEIKNDADAMAEAVEKTFPEEEEDQEDGITAETDEGGAVG